MFEDTESSREKFTRIVCSDIYKENTIKNKSVNLCYKWQYKLQHKRTLLLQPYEHEAGGTNFGQSSQGTGELDLEWSHQGSSTQQSAFLKGRPPPSGGSAVWLSMAVLSMPNHAFSEEILRWNPLTVQAPIAVWRMCISPKHREGALNYKKLEHDTVMLPSFWWFASSLVFSTSTCLAAFQHWYSNSLLSNFSISLVSVCFLPFFPP